MASFYFLKFFKQKYNEVDYTINLVLAYENIGKPDTAEINKKIILIKIIGLSILIILLITKFIVK